MPFFAIGGDRRRNVEDVQMPLRRPSRELWHPRQERRMAENQMIEEPATRSGANPPGRREADLKMKISDVK